MSLPNKFIHIESIKMHHRKLLKINNFLAYINNSVMVNNHEIFNINSHADYVFCYFHVIHVGTTRSNTMSYNTDALKKKFSSVDVAFGNDYLIRYRYRIQRFLELNYSITLLDRSVFVTIPYIKIVLFFIFFYFSYIT